VLHCSGLDAQIADLGDAAILELDYLEEVLHVVIDCALDEGLDAGGPADRGQDGYLAHPLLGEREGVVEKWHVGEVIGVEVADPDGVQVLEPDIALQGSEHASPMSTRTLAPPAWRR